MKRRRFIKSSCCSVVGFPIITSVFQSCTYYASAVHSENRLVVAKSEFLKVKKNRIAHRDFVLVKMGNSEFPICVHRIEEENYIASLLKCTHQGCELNVGGGIYSCPCHGSEFSISGRVLEGPADQDLLTFKIDTDSENIYIS